MKLMKFNRDMFYNDLNIPLYRAGVVYEIDEKMVSRWIKRGGEVVTEKPSKVEGPSKEPVEGQEKKLEDKAKPLPKQSGTRK